MTSMRSESARMNTEEEVKRGSAPLASELISWIRRFVFAPCDEGGKCVRDGGIITHKH